MPEIFKNRKFLVAALIFLVLLFILVILLVVRSRGSNNNNGDTTTGGNTTGQSPTKNVNLVYWGLWEPPEVMEPIISRYESQNPGVKIEYVQKSFTDYEEIAFTRVAEGSTDGSPTADIIRINNSWLSRFQGYLTPMPQSIMTPSQFNTTFYPTHLNDLTGTDGQIYAIPLEIDGLALFYNKDLFAQAGLNTPATDWDTVKEQATQLTQKDSSGNITIAGIGMGTAANVRHSADILNLLMLQNSVEPINETNTIVDLTDDRAVQALEFYVDFSENLGVWNSSLRSDLEMFFSGDLAMMIAPSWRAFDIINSNPSLNFDIVPVPQVGAQEINYAMYWAEAVPKNSDNPTEAWKFIKYLSEQQQLKEMYANASQVRAFGEPYSRKDLASEIQDSAYAGAFVKSAPTMIAWKMGIQSYVEEQLRSAIDGVADGAIDADGALLEAETNINEQLATSIN